MQSPAAAAAPWARPKSGLPRCRPRPHGRDVLRRQTLTPVRPQPMPRADGPFAWCAAPPPRWPIVGSGARALARPAYPRLAPSADEPLRADRAVTRSRANRPLRTDRAVARSRANRPLRADRAVARSRGDRSLRADRAVAPGHLLTDRYGHAVRFYQRHPSIGRGEKTMRSPVHPPPWLSLAPGPARRQAQRRLNRMAMPKATR